MAVIVRQDHVIGGKLRQGVPAYLSTRPVSAQQREQALRLDRELQARMSLITADIEKAGLLDLKNRAGVVALWWEVGRRLRDFGGDIDVGPEEDRQFLWRALYDHAPALVPGKLGRRAERLLNSHFFYCFLLGKYDLERVKAVGDWTSWVEIFDSERIRADDRILDWLVERASGQDRGWMTFMNRRRMDWFRPLAKAVRRTFEHRDTSGLTRGELYAELDDVFRRISTPQ